MRTSISTFLIISGVCTLLVSPGNAPAQESSPEWILSMLRGRWTYRTYENTWSLNFLNDSSLIYNDEEMKFDLTAAGIRISRETGDTVWPYHVEDAKLTIRIPPDGERTFDRKSGGSDELRVAGTFESRDGILPDMMIPSPASWITFDGMHDDVALFPPGADDMFERILYKHRVFVLRPEMVAGGDPIPPEPLPPPFPPPPPPIPHPHPPNPEPKFPDQMPPSVPPKPGKNPVRDFGSTRGEGPAFWAGTHRDSTNRDRR